MKKLALLGMTVLTVASLAACTSGNVTSQDLQKNDWETDKKDESTGMKMMSSFTDNEMTFYFDTSEMETSNSSGLEALGEEFGKSLLENIKFEFDYTLEKNKLTLKSEDEGLLDVDSAYTVKKDGKKIILTPVDSDQDGKIILTPAP